MYQAPSGLAPEITLCDVTSPNVTASVDVFKHHTGVRTKDTAV